MTSKNDLKGAESKDSNDLSEVTRRQFLRLLFISTLSPFFLNGDAELPEETKYRLNMREFENIVGPPTDEELKVLKDTIKKDILSPIQPLQNLAYSKDGLKIEIVAETCGTSVQNKSIIIHNETIPFSGKVLIYFHSLEGLNYDISWFRNDFNNLWNNGDYVIFPTIKEYVARKSNFNDLLNINNLDLTEIHGHFEDNSYINIIKLISHVYKNIPTSESSSRHTDMVGISLGGSVGLSILALWDLMRQDGYDLPDINYACFYAPISALLDRRVLSDALRTTCVNKNLPGPHQILKNFVYYALNRQSQIVIPKCLDEQLSLLNDKGIRELRNLLIYFSPSYVLQAINQNKNILPLDEINILYARFDPIINTGLVNDLINDLKNLGVNVKTDILFGGHLYNRRIFNLIEYMLDETNFD